jgi:hypothetical protein
VCETIAGATGQSYRTTTEDIGHNVEAYVKGTRSGVSSSYYLAGVIGLVQNKFPVNTIKPQILGDPFTGSVLSSNVGAWDGFDMRYERRWLRCNQDGVQCNPTNPVVTASSYALTAADRNSRLVLEVKAIAEDESQDRVTTATSDPSPIIGDPPVTAAETPPGGTGIPPGTTPDTNAPVASRYGLTNTRFAVGSRATPASGNATAAGARRAKTGTTFRYTLSEGATVKIAIAERRPGRRRGRRCVAPTRKLRKAKRCTRLIARGTLTRVSLQGANKVAFTGRIGRKALRRGSYQASLTATDAAGNSSKPRVVRFTVVKR